MQGSPPHSSLSCPSSSWHSFRLGSVQAPTRSPLGCPLPPIPSFQTEGLLSGGWMENKAPLSGWRRIGVMGRGRARKGWLCAGHQLDSRRPQHHSGGGAEGHRGRARERILAGVWTVGRESGFRGQDSAGGCVLGARRKDPPPRFSAGRGTQIHAVFMWCPWAVSQSLAPDSDKASPHPIKEGTVPIRRGEGTQGGAQSKQEVQAGIETG